MNPAVSDLATLLRSMEPVLYPGVFVWCVVPHDADFQALTPVATIHEAEGTTVIVAEPQAADAGLAILFRAARITLGVHSDLQAVGLTAAFSGALAQAGISCNVVAGAFHDQLFVPVETGRQALQVLRALQQSGNIQA